MEVDYNELYWEMESLEEALKSIEYDFVTAESFGERRELLKTYRETEASLRSLEQVAP